MAEMRRRNRSPAVAVSRVAVSAATPAIRIRARDSLTAVSETQDLAKAQAPEGQSHYRPFAIYKTCFSNTSNDGGFASASFGGSSHGKGANTEPLGKRRTFGGADAQQPADSGSSGFASGGFGSSSNSSNANSGFANGGFGNSGFGAPASTPAPGGGFGNSSAAKTSEGFGNASFGAPPQPQPATPSPSSGFGNGGFGRPASEPAKPTEAFGSASGGFGNSGFGAPPSMDSSTSSSSEALEGGFGSSGPPRKVNWGGSPEPDDVTDEPAADAAASGQGSYF